MPLWIKQTHLGGYLLVALMTLSEALAAAESSLTQYQEIEWIALIPEDDLAALLDPPEYIFNIEDGSEQDSVAALSQQDVTDEKTKRFQQALTSTRIVQAFDGKAIRIPGFIVPLESEEQLKVTEFFIVPYFGACLHLPPPPPNQIIYATHAPGVELNSLTQPFWFSGKLKIEHTENGSGASAYRLLLDEVKVFSEEE